MSTTDPDGVVQLDARGERCPLPVIRLGRLALELGPGALVRLLADDQAALSDVPAFCRMRGHDLLATSLWAGPPVSPDTRPDTRPDGPATAYLVRVSATAPAAAPGAPRRAARGSATGTPA
ncbi:sulfurtransferase TusA family protein [Dermatophilaceae bacterium Soc4.6]